MGSSAASPLAPGTRLAQYELEDALGTGGSATVYRARNVETGARVALKRASEDAKVARWEIEARLLAELDHPAVVSLVDHFEEPDGVYNIVMRMVDGIDLGRLLWDRGNPGLPVDEVSSWIRSACSGLVYLRDQQIVHGDIKPRNLISHRQQLVMVDFGIASRASASGGDRAIAGTARFMAPEVFAGHPATHLSDVYGLAATAWTLLTGTPPAYGEARPLDSLIDDISPEVGAAVKAGLEFEPGKRLESAGPLGDAFGSPIAARSGTSLAVSVAALGRRRHLMETVVSASAAALDASAASIAITDPKSGKLGYIAAWGAGAGRVVGMRLDRGVGLAGATVASGVTQVVPHCRRDSRFAAAVASTTGYVPHTMLVTPLRRDGAVIGAMSLLDRRGGEPYGPDDIPRAELLAEVAAAAMSSGALRRCIEEARA